MSGKKKLKRIRLKVRYPAHLFVPEELLSFIESKIFLAAWNRCGLSDSDLRALQIAIMLDPNGHPVIAGTGGLRKIRFSPTGSGRGKSGSHRVCYVYFEEFGIVFLVTAYAKNRKDDLSTTAKSAIRRMIDQQHRLLLKGPIQ